MVGWFAGLFDLEADAAQPARLGDADLRLRKAGANTREEFGNGDRDLHTHLIVWAISYGWTGSVIMAQLAGLLDALERIGDQPGRPVSAHLDPALNNAARPLSHWVRCPR